MFLLLFSTHKAHYLCIYFRKNLIFLADYPKSINYDFENQIWPAQAEHYNFAKLLQYLTLYHFLFKMLFYTL